MNAQQLVKSLIDDCSPREQLCLLAWANAERLDHLHEKQRNLLHGSNFGPPEDDDGGDEHDPILVYGAAAGK